MPLEEIAISEDGKFVILSAHSTTTNVKCGHGAVFDAIDLRLNRDSPLEELILISLLLILLKTIVYQDTMIWKRNRSVCYMFFSELMLI
jgi:hypothetical protein